MLVTFLTPAPIPAESSHLHLFGGPACLEWVLPVRSSRGCCEGVQYYTPDRKGLRSALRVCSTAEIKPELLRVCMFVLDHVRSFENAFLRLVPHESVLQDEGRGSALPWAALTARVLIIGQPPVSVGRSQNDPLTRIWPSVPRNVKRFCRTSYSVSCWLGRW